MDNGQTLQDIVLSFKTLRDDSPAGTFLQAIRQGKEEPCLCPDKALVLLDKKSPLLGLETGLQLSWQWLAVLDKARQENKPFTLAKLGEGFLDLGQVRLLSEVDIYTPCSQTQGNTLWHDLQSADRPCYLRLPLQSSPETAPMHKRPGFNIWREGHDLVILTCGSGVETALTLTDRLKKQQLSCGVLEIWDWAALDLNSLYMALSSYIYLASLEPHTPRGGLGCIMLELLSEFGKSHAVLCLGYGSETDCRLPVPEELEDIIHKKIF